ncbi:phosphopyruvate hydratase [Patescibacteria group bacterium]|nr:phosphopyruvate hydratase [Patescibacteria group bacterium]
MTDTGPAIAGVFAHEILDSRANPTVETLVTLTDGYWGLSSVPAGASVSKYEAVELRDGDDKRYKGMGVLKAVANVNTVIAPKLRGMSPFDQWHIDDVLRELDGTPNLSKLGANAVLSVSLAVAVTAANVSRVPLYRYLNKLFSGLVPTEIKRIPAPVMNIINGGKHGAGNLNFQEFHVIPATNKSYSEALRLGVEVYQQVKEILIYRNAIHSVGDEGGFAPNLYTNADAIEILLEAIRTASYHYGVDVFIGLDLAASVFKTPGGYKIIDKPSELPEKAFIDFLKDLHKKYHFLLLEDALDQDDWDGWKELTQSFGAETLIVGDDFLATNEERLTRAVREKACTAILLKPNQIGTLSSYFKVVALAKKNNIHCIVSHRSGETNDSFIADLGVAVQSEYVKFGAPARGERVAKYNRLLQIETDLIAGKR